MRCLLISILLFITTNCLAIDQELIDGAKKYDAAVESSRKVLEARIASKMPLDEFIKTRHKMTDYSLSNEDREAAKNKIDEENKKWNELNLQYTEAEALVKKLEPLKNEYDKQKNIEFENNQFKITILVITIIVLIFITSFGTFIYFAVAQHKKYQQLLKEGKITQEEYDRIMQQCHQSKSMFSNDLGTNPSTGLPLVGNGVCDAGGNLRGSSETRSSFDYSRNYNSSSMR